MLKTPLTQSVTDMLEKNDYVTCQYRGCFDIAAKKSILLLLKVLQNVDALQEEQAKNLKIISNNLDADALLVGIQTRKERLQKGIVYERFGLPTISPDTLEALICYGIFPQIYRDRGGFYVEIDSDLVRETRRKKNLTQKELAEAVGVNKKVVYEHEKKQLRMFLSVARRLEDILEEKIIKNINLFESEYQEHGSPKDLLEKEVGRDLEKLGFVTDFVKQAPFDIFAKEKALIVSDIEIDKRKIEKRASAFKSFASVAQRPALIITEKAEADVGIPVIQRKELEGLTKKELIRIAKRKK